LVAPFRLRDADAIVRHRLAHRVDRPLVHTRHHLVNVTTPEYAAMFFRSEMMKYATIVKKIGLEPQ